MRITGDLDTSSVQPGARGRSLQSVRPRPAGGGGHGHSGSAGRESRARGVERWARGGIWRLLVLDKVSNLHGPWGLEGDKDAAAAGLRIRRPADLSFSRLMKTTLQKALEFPLNLLHAFIFEKT